jgi:hypothetical protein
MVTSTFAVVDEALRDSLEVYIIVEMLGFKFAG